MAKLRHYLNFLPETGLTLVVLFYWSDTGLLNPIAAGLFLILLQQFIFRRPKIGFAVGTIFVFLSLWMLLAWLSDIRKINVWDERAYQFLYFGFVFCGVLMTASVFTIVKYSRTIELR